MPPARSFECKWDGCDRVFWNLVALDEHELTTHLRCEGCEHYFVPFEFNLHRTSCVEYQRFLRRKQWEATSRCSGCGREIVEGQHYLRIPKLIVQARMPVDYVPVQEEPDSVIKLIVLCSPECFIKLGFNNELITNVFGPTPDVVPAPRERMYEMYVEGTPSWLTLHQAAIVVLDVAHGYGQRVCELDGTTRQLEESDRDEIVRRARAIMDGS